MKYDGLSREELIEKLEAIEEERAFTYEDQMKLAILDQSPFTIWASNRECEITLWSGQCEALYGYSKDYVMGKDYVDLFVAPDEQAQARLDQLGIIDEAEVFHNIANDVAKNGNTLQLVTNCFRIKDIRTGEYWNAEMGLIIDYLEQEKERLARIVAKSQKVKSFVDQFIVNTNQCKEHFTNRKKSLRIEIAAGERRAVQIGRRLEFKEKINPIIALLNELQQTLYQLIDDHYERMQNCISSGSCESVKSGFNQQYDDIIIEFEGIVLDFEEINLAFLGNNTVFHLKESIYKENSERNIRLSNLAFDKLNKANEAIAEYQSMSSSIEPQSAHYGCLIRRRDEIQIVRSEIQRIADRIMVDILNLREQSVLLDIRRNMLEQYMQLEQRLV